MQVTIEIPDKLVKAVSKKFKKPTWDKIITEALEEKVEKENNVREDSFFKWALSEKGTSKETKRDVAEKHDQYLYGDKH